MAQCRRDVTAEQFLVALDSTFPDFTASLVTRRSDGDPVIDPFCQRQFRGRDVCTCVTRMQHIPQSFLSLRLCPTHSFCETSSVQPIAQPPSVFTALINAAVSVAAFTSHVLAPSRRDLCRAPMLR